jgi:hypothetical protein
LIVTDKLEVEPVMVDRDSKTGGAFGQIQHLPERWLGQLVVVAIETKQHATSLFGNQG